MLLWSILAQPQTMRQDFLGHMRNGLAGGAGICPERINASTSMPSCTAVTRRTSPDRAAQRTGRARRGDRRPTGAGVTHGDLAARHDAGQPTITLEGTAPDGTLRLVVYTIEVGRPCTITGSSKRDVIIGSRGDDVICAGGGNDLVFALGGGDVVYGGAGNDIINGGLGDDHLDGGDGFDLVIGGPGRDTLIDEIRWK